ncbi:hypothetical protein [Actinoallomurus soli]|uniref:hypothetical protein n=1 Tax=Actinoallomurus soli TaxID=2952535 RepID=UPI002092B332|nr:hypothetical protein [Actinoallomurus soli]MCO5974370.1 hypothetical protein [Actinoallomurus soli]
MVDEMDLLRRLEGTGQVRPAAFDKARSALRAAMAAEEVSEIKGVTEVGNVTEIKTASHRRARWGKGRTVGFGAVGLAAAAAVALVVTSTSGSASGHNTSASGSPSTAAAASEGNPILARLAANNMPLSTKLPGDATLEIRNQSPTSEAVGGNGIDIYTDDGTYHWAVDKRVLPKVAGQNQDDGEGTFKRDIAAALYAVKGDINTARARMAVANLIPGKKVDDGTKAANEKLKAIAKEKGKKFVPLKPLTPIQKKDQTDNFIWTNAIDALVAAPQNPQVRAGVLRIMASMPNVKVVKSSTAGRPTLTLSDTWPHLDDSKLVESLVINADTGAPVALFNRAPGQPLNATYYHVRRVSLSDLKAGKF